MTPGAPRSEPLRDPTPAAPERARPDVPDGRRTARGPEADRVLIIGAGIGGLSAAIHLAAAGYRVLILEQNPRVGGKMSRLQAGGFTWDTGPTVITMRPVFEQLFAAAHRSLDDYLTLLPVEPLTRYFYADGVVLDATRDLPRMAAQIAALESRDVAGYLKFLAHAATLDRITGPVVIEGDPPSLGKILRVSPRDMVPVATDALQTMDGAIRRRIRDPHLRQLFARFATYVGASPYRAPAVLNVIAHKELTQGIWYPQGGVYTVAEAFERLATELGVTIHTGTRVAAIDVDGTGRATGVTLEGGARMKGRAVIANVDVVTAYRDLLPRAVAGRRLSRLLRREPSLSGFALMLGLRGTTPELTQHNVLFASDYRREFHDIFMEGRPPRKPTLYISISARRDPDHAPPGHENWFVLANAPPLGAFDWETNREQVRNWVLDQLAARGFDVRPRIVTEASMTPEDLHRRTGAWRGGLYGLSSNRAIDALWRPHPRDRTVRGLYFAGGTTHPGGGVPMVTLSGSVAARMVMEDATHLRG